LGVVANPIELTNEATIFVQVEFEVGFSHPEV
jgi:hypothetical protein